MLGVESDSRVVLQQGHILACVTTAFQTMPCGAELIRLDTHSGAITPTDCSIKFRGRTCHYTRLEHPVCNWKSMTPPCWLQHISSPENTKTAQQSFEKPLSLRAYRLSYQYVCKLQLSLVWGSIFIIAQDSTMTCCCCLSRIETSRGFRKMIVF